VRTHAYVQTGVRIDITSCVFKCVHAHTHKYVYTQIHEYMHAYIHAYIPWTSALACSYPQRSLAAPPHPYLPSALQKGFHQQMDCTRRQEGGKGEGVE
jgi:hypothetical protein